MATFGKTSTGATSSGSSVAGRIRASQGTPASDGTATKLTARVSLNSAGTSLAKCAVFADSAGEPGALIAVSDEVTVNWTTDTATDFALSGGNQFAVVSGTPYWLAVYHNDPGTPTLRINADATAGFARVRTMAPYPTIVDPFGTATTQDFDWDIFVTYTEGGGATGTSAVAFGFATDGVGVEDFTGTSNVDFPFATLADGVAGASGTGDSTFTYSTDALGIEDFIGTSAVDFLFSTDSSGAAGAVGSGTSAFDFSTDGVGGSIEPVTGSGDSAFGFSTDSAGAVGASGTGDSAFDFSTAGSGAQDFTGTSSVEFVYETLADGTVSAIGDSSIAFGYATAGVGAVSAMTPTVTELASFADGTDLQQYVVPTFTPTGGTLYVSVLTIQSSGTAASRANLSGNGVTWTRILDNPFGSALRYRHQVFESAGVPSAGALTIDVESLGNIGLIAIVYQVDGPPIRLQALATDSVAGTSTSHGLSFVSLRANVNVVLAFFVTNNNTTIDLNSDEGFDPVGFDPAGFGGWLESTQAVSAAPSWTMRGGYQTGDISVIASSGADVGVWAAALLELAIPDAGHASGTAASTFGFSTASVGAATESTGTSSLAFDFSTDSSGLVSQTVGGVGDSQFLFGTVSAGIVGTPPNIFNRGPAYVPAYTTYADYWGLGSTQEVVENGGAPITLWGSGPWKVLRASEYANINDPSLQTVLREKTLGPNNTAGSHGPGLMSGATLCDNVLIHNFLFDNIRAGWGAVTTGFQGHAVNAAGDADHTIFAGCTFNRIGVDAFQWGGGGSALSKAWLIDYCEMIGPGNSPGADEPWGENATDFKGGDGPALIRHSIIRGFRRSGQGGAGTRLLAFNAPAGQQYILMPSVTVYKILDPIKIEDGGNTEYAVISSISGGDRLSLMQPLQFTHLAGVEVKAQDTSGSTGVGSVHHCGGNPCGPPGSGLGFSVRYVNTLFEDNGPTAQLVINTDELAPGVIIDVGWGCEFRNAAGGAVHILITGAFPERVRIANQVTFDGSGPAISGPAGYARYDDLEYPGSTTSGQSEVAFGFATAASGVAGAEGSSAVEFTFATIGAGTSAETAITGTGTSEFTFATEGIGTTGLSISGSSAVTFGWSVGAGGYLLDELQAALLLNHYLTYGFHLDWNKDTIYDDLSARMVRAGGHSSMDLIYLESHIEEWTVDVENTDSVLSPTNTVSPFYPDTRALRQPAKLNFAWNGLGRQVLQGRVYGLLPEEGITTLNIEASNTFDTARRVRQAIVDIPPIGDVKTGVLGRDIMARAGFTTAEYNFEDGDVTIQYAAGKQKNVWTELNNLALIETGLLFFDESGVLRFQSNTSVNAAKNNPSITLTSEDHLHTPPFRRTSEVDLWNTVRLSLPMNPDYHYLTDSLVLYNTRNPIVPVSNGRLVLPTHPPTQAPGDTYFVEHYFQIGTGEGIFAEADKDSRNADWYKYVPGINYTGSFFTLEANEAADFSGASVTTFVGRPSEANFNGQAPPWNKLYGELQTLDYATGLFRIRFWNWHQWYGFEPGVPAPKNVYVRIKILGGPTTILPIDQQGVGFYVGSDGASIGFYGERILSIVREYTPTDPWKAIELVNAMVTRTSQPLKRVRLRIDAIPMLRTGHFIRLIDTTVPGVTTDEVLRVVDLATSIGTNGAIMTVTCVAP